MNKLFINRFNTKDIIISLLISGVTFRQYLDEYFFSVFSKEIFDLWSLERLIYFSKMKTLIISFSLIWYFTCKHWWRYILFLPLSFEIFKLLGFVNDRYNLYDNFNFYHNMPLVLFTIIVLLLLSEKVRYYLSKRKLPVELNYEIFTFINKI